jgi:glycosyltransferase involved in cell wall biosynthesis
VRIQIQGSLGKYGVQSFVEYLASSLKKINIQVSVAPPPGSFAVSGVRGQRRLAKEDLQDHLYKATGSKADLVHLNYAFPSLPLVLNPLSRVPFLYTVHGVPRPHLEPELRFKIGYVLEQASLRAVAKRVDRVIAISGYVQKLLLESYGINSDVIPNGVDTDLFHPISPETKVSLRSKTGIPVDAKIVLFVGRLYPYKDPLTLVGSVRHVVRRLPGVLFIVVGEGPLRKAMISDILSSGIEASVRLVSFLPRAELIRMVQMADVQVSTAPAEMFGFSVLEAMSCGIPVVAAGGGGPVEVLGRSGTFFKPGNTVDLAEKLLHILRDDGTRLTLGQAAREIALRDYAWEKVASKYADVYKRVIDGSRNNVSLS